MLFSPPMLDHEAILISGTQRYCETAGYGYDLRFARALPVATFALFADKHQRVPITVMAQQRLGVVQRRSLEPAGMHDRIRPGQHPICRRSESNAGVVGEGRPEFFR